MLSISSKLILRIAMSIAGFLPFLVACSQNCVHENDIYSFVYHGKKYELVKEKKSWADAASCAVERKGYLAEINSKEEQDSIYYFLSVKAGLSGNYTSVQDGGGIAYVWIGATDGAKEGHWKWDGDHNGNGTDFWNGTGKAGQGGGGAVEASYVNWGGTSSGSCNEPDDFDMNQDAAAMALASWPKGAGAPGLGKAGEWNDISMANRLYFVIEHDRALTR